MTVVAVEGFDMYNGITNTSTNVGLRSRWTSPFNSNSLQAGRLGGQSARFENYPDYRWANYMPLPATYTSGCVGFAIYPEQAGSTTFPFFSYGAAFYISMDGIGAIRVQRTSSASIATSTTLVPTLAWSYLEVEFVISETVGEIRVYLNDDPTPIIDVSGVNTSAVAPGPFLIFSGNASTYSCRFDDIYVTDTPNRLGEQRVITNYVNGDASPSDWQSSTIGAAPYTMIDETLCDGDTTYVYASNIGARSVYAVGNLSVAPTTINAVQISSFARKSDAGSRSIELQYETPASTVYSSDTYALATGGTYSKQLYLMPLNPDTNAEWTANAVNDIKVGLEVIA